jgi:epoxyqueuosine reductase
MVERLQSSATQSSDTAPEPRSHDSRSQIRENALRIGFDAVGFSRASLGPEVRERLSQFIESGFHGDMGWLVTRSEQRSSPECVWRSVIVVALSFAPEENHFDVVSQLSNGAISVYARNQDYHKVLRDD